MPNPRLDPEACQEAVNAWNDAGKSPAGAAHALGLNYATYRRRLRTAWHRGYRPHADQPDTPAPAPAAPPEPVIDGTVHETQPAVKPAPEQGAVKRYLLTCAQNNTHVHGEMWRNMEALAQHYSAEILVSRFTYNMAAYKARGGPRKPGDEPADPNAGIWYEPRLAPYLSDHRVQLAPDLIWCAEVQILPTAVRPLSGFEAYTGPASGVFPHPKIAMESIATQRHDPPKMNFTTGACTLRNYIKAKAGFKAEFHHSYGALLVEVDAGGAWWARQVSATADGALCDLDVQVTNGVVSTGNRVEAVVWGDIHEARLDPTVRQGAWGTGAMLDQLRPRYQVYHDLIDFRARNHHERDDPHKLYERHVRGEDSVARELRGAVDFLTYSRRPWCTGIVVESNHNEALVRWLREEDGRFDAPNAEFWIDATKELYAAIKRGDQNFHVLEWALRRVGAAPERFLRTDESFVLCPGQSGGIEVGGHGHLGPNGARGAPKQFAKLGRKCVTAHTHSAGVIDGVYTAGTSTLMDLGYNRGPSAWSHSHVLVYETGKRAVVTMRGGKYRAAPL